METRARRAGWSDPGGGVAFDEVPNEPSLDPGNARSGADALVSRGPTAGPNAVSCYNKAPRGESADQRRSDDP